LARRIDIGGIVALLLEVVGRLEESLHVFDLVVPASPGERNGSSPYEVIFDLRGLRVRAPSEQPLEALSEDDLGAILERWFGPSGA